MLNCNLTFHSTVLNLALLQNQGIPWGEVSTFPATFILEASLYTQVADMLLGEQIKLCQCSPSRWLHVNFSMVNLYGWLLFLERSWESIPKSGIFLLLTLERENYLPFILLPEGMCRNKFMSAHPPSLHTWQRVLASLSALYFSLEKELTVKNTMGLLSSLSRDRIFCPRTQRKSADLKTFCLWEFLAWLVLEGQDPRVWLYHNLYQKTYYRWVIFFSWFLHFHFWLLVPCCLFVSWQG